MKRFLIPLMFAVLLSACGGTPAETPLPTLAPDPDNSSASTNTTPEAEVQADTVIESSIQDLDPSTLEANSFQVEVINNKGEKIMLQPFTAEDENAQLLYITGSHSVMDFMEPPYREISFTRVTRDNPDSGMTSSDVKLQLPVDVQPGTYTVTSMAPNLDDGSVYGAWISIFDGDYAIYDQYSGTITITEVTDKTISGSFAVAGKNNEGYTSTVTGVFNELSSTRNNPS